MTTRAAVAMYHKVVGAPRARALAAYKAAMESHQYAVGMQKWEFPTCRLIPEAEWDRRQAEVAQSIYGWQRDTVARIVALAGSVQAGEEIACAHVESPVTPVALWEGSTSVRCECALCLAVGDLSEAEKEERKSIWYGSDQWCRCATCAPMGDAPTAPTFDEDVSPVDFMGEAGADY